MEKQIQKHCNERSPQKFSPERYTDLVRRRGGLKPTGASDSNAAAAATTQKLTKLLVNVNFERSIGPVQVVTRADNTVSDLIKAAIEIYVREKRRPLLKEIDPNFFSLHYSQFSLESLKAGEKLINLGSRNFFLCSKHCASEEAN